MAILTNADVAAKARGVAAERRVSYGTIAQALNLSTMAVSRRMNAQTPFDPEELIRLGRLLRVPVSTFFGEIPPIAPDLDVSSSDRVEVGGTSSSPDALRRAG